MFMFYLFYPTNLMIKTICLLYQVNIDKIVSIMINDYVLLGIISWTGERLTMANNNN